MWLAIAAYVVVASRHARQERAAIRVETLRIAIVDTVESRVVTTEKVRRWLAEESVSPVGRTIDSTDTRALERHIATRPEVKHVSAWTDLGGTLNVRIEPRTPAFRVRTSNGYRFWYTTDGVIIPDRGEFTAHTPVVTGSIPFPFGPAAGGSYDRILRAVYNDYLARFRALDTERQSLESRSAELRSKITSTRRASPGYWWNDSRRAAFRTANDSLAAELERERRGVLAQLRRVERLGTELREKEKNSQQSLRFLSKLANFVKFIEASDFWSVQIVQIDVASGVGTGRANGSGGKGETWTEPQLELIPRAGDHTIVLGELDGTERQRLDNLRLFYRRTLWHEGWDAYTTVNIKYRNQIVCTK
jgi:hypothetical protein